MKNLLNIFFIALVLVISSGCTQTETVDLSESSLANTLYIQNSPSGGVNKQYYFSENTLTISSTDKITPDLVDTEKYESSISEEYDNIKVTEKKDEIIITDENELSIVFTKTSDGLLKNEDGVTFIKKNWTIDDSTYRGTLKVVEYWGNKDGTFTATYSGKVYKGSIPLPDSLSEEIE